MDQPHQPKLITIGLDGSTWDLIKPLIEQGRLPNLKKMIEGGSHSTLNSTNPAHSAPAWTTFQTGVYPTQHGCFDFLTIDKDIDNLKLIDSTQFPQETIYEMMLRHGKKPILFNLTNSYPARTAEPTVTGLMTRGDEFIFPSSLKDKYPELADYRLSPDPTLKMKDSHEPHVKDLCDIERKRVEAAKAVFKGEDWDFFFFLSSGTDWVSHVVYDKAVREGYEPALQMWDIMDEFIGWILENKDDETNVMIMSDHGFKAYDQIFYVNRWLEDNGYLGTIDGAGTFAQDTTKFSKEISKAQNKRTKITVGKGVRSLLGKSAIVEKIAKFIYFKIIRRFIPITVTFDVKIDLATTKVGFPRGSWAVMLYVNDKKRFKQGIVDEDEKQELIAKLKTELEALKDKDGDPIIKSVKTREEMYPITTVTASPDIFLEPGKYYLSGSLHSSSLIENSIKNSHNVRGIFLAYGPDIAQQELEPQDIHQMAPTILQSMGLPQQEQFVAKPITTFKQKSPIANPLPTENLQEHHAIGSMIDDLDI